MKSKLSPQGRKLALMGTTAPVRAIVQIRRGSRGDDLCTLLERLEAEALSTGAESGLATIVIRADRLDALAESSAVDYVEVGGRMSPPTPD